MKELMDDHVRRLHDIEESILDHPKIALFVACTDVIGHEPARALVSAAGLFVISSRGDVARRLLLVENRRCASTFPRQLARKLRFAFTL